VASDDPLRVFLLKYFDAEAWRRENAEPDGWQLPYALDAFDAAVVDLRWSDAVQRPPWTTSWIRRIVRPLERIAAPFLDTLISARSIGRSDAVLTVFESEANSIAVLRSLGIPPYTRPRLAVVSCWLADRLPTLSPPRRALYRLAYRRVDRIIYFSRNQGPAYRELLGVPEDRLAFVPFGVDHRYFAPRDVADDGYVLAVGRDRGRDWPTFFDAVGGTALPVKVVCRPAEIADLNAPTNVELLGVVDRATYRDLTARARVVAVPTHVRAYPSGQSVVLEAMAMAKPVVVTDTPAMRDYVSDEVTALLVPPGDPVALRDVLGRVMHDAGLRSRLGKAGRERVELELNAPAMWRTVASTLGELGRASRAAP
jgi:glycosyltransferase involved in cell wall biosynthesis